MFQIFDASNSTSPLGMTFEEVGNCTLGAQPSFKRLPFLLQKMGIRESDKRLGHVNMWDTSYYMERPKATIDMVQWVKDKSLFIVEQPRFELVCHGKLIPECLKQVEQIIEGEISLSDYYNPEITPDYWVLDNRYFFSTIAGRGEKFIEYLKD